MIFKGLSEAEIRQICKERIETLEFWMRRLIDEEFLKVNHDYFNYIDDKNNRLIKKSIRDKAQERMVAEPNRYSRYVDATLMDDLITIICNPVIYKSYFENFFIHNFPSGNEVLRYYLNKIYEPRNNLAHANPISLRQAEQIICYTNDILESIKFNYRQLGKEKMFNVPQIIRVNDSLGHVYERSQIPSVGSSLILNLKKPEHFHNVNDFLTFELEIDSTYEAEEYSINWAIESANGYDHIHNSKKLEISLEEKHIRETLHIQAKLVSNKTWHKHGDHDDHLIIVVTVLPPI